MCTCVTLQIANLVPSLNLHNCGELCDPEHMLASVFYSNFFSIFILLWDLIYINPKINRWTVATALVWYVFVSTSVKWVVLGLIRRKGSGTNLMEKQSWSLFSFVCMYVRSIELDSRVRHKLVFIIFWDRQSSNLFTYKYCIVGKWCPKSVLLFRKTNRTLQDLSGSKLESARLLHLAVTSTYSRISIAFGQHSGKLISSQIVIVRKRWRVIPGKIGHSRLMNW